MTTDDLTNIFLPVPADESAALYDLRLYVQEVLLRHPLRKRLVDRLLGHGGGLRTVGLHLARAALRRYRPQKRAAHIRIHHRVSHARVHSFIHTVYTYINTYVHT